MEDGSVTNFNLRSLFMHPVPTCCTRIVNIFNMAVILTKVMNLYCKRPATEKFVIMSDVL